MYPRFGTVRIPLPVQHRDGISDSILTVTGAGPDDLQFGFSNGPSRPANKINPRLHGGDLRKRKLDDELKKNCAIGEAGEAQGPNP